MCKKCTFQDDGTKNPPKVSTVSLDAKRVVQLSDQDTFNLQLSVSYHIKNVFFRYVFFYTLSEITAR